MKKRIILPLVAAALAGVAVSAQVNSQLSENEIKSRVSKTQSDLRSLHTAVESYKVDWNFYPSSLVAITTPISYLSSFCPDPFEVPLQEGQPIPEHLIPEGGMFGRPGILKMSVVEDQNASVGGKYIIYGVGPDGVDDRGALEYDPTNGAVSAGDILRVISEEEFPLVFFDSTIGEELKLTAKRQMAVRDAMIAYGIKEKDFPKSLGALTTPVAYLNCIPEDPFLPGLPLGYQLTGEGETRKATIYSVGPDLDDDLGKRRLFFSSEQSQFGDDGDIALVLPWSQIEQQIQPFKDESGYQEGVNPWKLALLKLQEEQGGRDNAFLWYHEAHRLSPGVPSNSQEELIQALLKGEAIEPEKIRPWLDQWQEAFELIERGTELDDARGPGAVQGYETPVPNFMILQNSCKALAAEINLAVNAGDMEKALKYLKMGLIMSRDCQSEGSFLISYLVGYATSNVMTNAAAKVIDSGKLSQAQLAELRKTLLHVERTSKPLMEGIRMEQEATEKQLRISYSEHYEETLKQIQEEQMEEGMIPITELPPLEPLLAKLQTVQQSILQSMEGPHYSRSFAEIELPKSKSSIEHFILNQLINLSANFQETSTREAYSLAKLQTTRIAAAIKSFELETGSAPATLEELAPFLDNSVPVDPFNGNPNGYVSNEDGTWRVWSVGPNQFSEEGLKRFDFQFGTNSEGDIVYPFP